MARKIITSIFLLLILTIGLCLTAPSASFAESAENNDTEEKVSAQAVTAQGIPVEPTGSRFSPSNTFVNAPGDAVDPGSGALTIKQTDILLPGKGGLNLGIGRTYNSKGFKSNPRPDYFKNANEIWDIWDWGSFKDRVPSHEEYLEKKARDRFNFRLPLMADQWGGWMGQGWQSSIGGRLVVGYSDINHAYSLFNYNVTGGIDWSENECPDPFDAIRINVGTQTYVFNHRLEPKDKGQRAALQRTSDGYLLITKDGTQYRFEKRQYYKLERYKHHQSPYDSFEFRSEVYHLSSIQDLNGNIIKFIYEAYGGEFYDKDEDNKNITIVIFGLKVSDTPIRSYKKELDYVKFVRPSKIIDSFGREINIYYRGEYNTSPLLASMIDHLSYKDSNGNLVTYQYVYDSNNRLKEVIPPEGNSTKFDYTYVTQNLGDDFEDKGYVLDKMTYPTGGTANYSYDWYNPGDYNSSLTGSKQEALSSYVVSRRAVNNSQIWGYSYGGGGLYSRYGEIVKADEDYKEDKGEAWNFNKVTVTDPIGDTAYEFEKGLAKRVENAEGHITSYTWDYDKKNLLSVTLNKGGTRIKTEYKDYDDYGNPGAVKEYGDVSDYSDDRELHFEYMHDKSSTYQDRHIVDRVAHAWIEKDGRRLNEVYSDYDAEGRGNLVEKREILDSGFAITLFGYDSSGNLTRSIDPIKHRVSYEYAGGSPNPTRISHLLIQTRSYYFNTGELKHESDFSGNITTYGYDKRGRLTKQTNPDGSTLTHTYYDSSNRIQAKDENNHVTICRYDNLGRLVGVDRPEGYTIRYQYNPLSKITAVTEAEKTTRYTYDRIGRLTGVSYPDGSSVSCDYLDSQNAVEVRDGEGNSTRYKYDGRGQLVEVTEANGNKTSYRYTASGMLAKAVDARGLATEYVYDRQSRLIETRYPDGRANTLGYDRAGNLTRKTDAKGQSIRYTYDAINRLRHISYPDPAYDVKYTYDGGNHKGQLTSMQDISGRTEYSYDQRGRLTTQRQSVGSITSSVNYAYDGVGNMVSIQDPIGNLKTSYAYDALDRIREVKRDTAGKGLRTIATYHYNTNNTINEMQFFNGIKMNYTYDQRDRLDTLRVLDNAGKQTLKHDYDYDAVGNRTSLDIAGVESISYGYDKVYRLTNVEYDNSEGNSVFSYDAVGNRTQFKYPYANVEYYYHPNSNQLDYLRFNQHGKIDYTFDENGNLIQEEYLKGKEAAKLTNYTYDAEDRLIQIRSPYLPVPNLDTPAVQDTVTNMTYDGNGNRVKKKSKAGTTLYHHDMANNVLCETDGKGKSKGYFIYANGQRICRIDPQGRMFFYHNDVLGSPALITDEDGKITQRYLFEPFGSILASKGKNDNHFTFTGKEYDLESGLFYFGARYYDPKIGRFITEDLAEPDYENPQSLNRYIYALNNPLKYVDPDGLVPTWPTHGRITSTREWRVLSGWGRHFHAGIDIANAAGTDVVAVLSGTVTSVNWSRGYGNNITIQHYYRGQALWSHYAHLGTGQRDVDAVLVEEGQLVSRGFHIGEMGYTGRVWSSTGNPANASHLHFAIFTRDPEIYGYNSETRSLDPFDILPELLNNNIPQSEVDRGYGYYNDLSSTNFYVGGAGAQFGFGFNF
jgi:RHS repeat-associated protein